MLECVSPTVLHVCVHSVPFHWLGRHMLRASLAVQKPTCNLQAGGVQPAPLPPPLPLANPAAHRCTRRRRRRNRRCRRSCATTRWPPCTWRGRRKGSTGKGPVSALDLGGGSGERGSGVAGTHLGPHSVVTPEHAWWFQTPGTFKCMFLSTHSGSRCRLWCRPLCSPGCRRMCS